MSNHCAEKDPDVTNMRLNVADQASLKRVVEEHKDYFPGEAAESWITQINETFPMMWATHIRRRNAHEVRQKEWEEEMRLIREFKLDEGRRRLMELWAEKQRVEMERKEGEWEKEKRDLERSVDLELRNLTLHIDNEEKLAPFPLRIKPLSPTPSRRTNTSRVRFD